MTVDELGQQTKAKHPEYSSYSDSEVGARVLSKYPEYRSQIGQPPIDPLEQTVNSSPFGQRILENLGIAAGGYGVGKLAGTGIVKAAESNLGKAILNSPKDIGEQYSALETKAGLSRKLPVQRGFEAKPALEIGGNPPPASELPYKPSTYPKNINSLLNFIQDRLDNFGKNIPLQELSDYKTMLGSNLSDMQAKGLSGTKPFAFASDLQNKISGLYNEALPGRSDLNSVYALSKNVRALPGKVYSGAKTVYNTMKYPAGLGLLYEMLKK